MKRRTGGTSSFPKEGGRCMKSTMSLPAVNTPSVPVMMKARTCGSASPVSSASAAAEYIAWVRAFFFSGRLKVIVRMRSAVSTSTSSLMRASQF